MSSAKKENQSENDISYILKIRDKEIENSDKQIKNNQYEIDKLQAKYDELVSTENI
jgi:hypothetical protein